MTSISGTLRVGEANATVGKLMARQRGSNASYWAIMLGLGFCGLIAGLAASFLVSNNGAPHYSAGGLLGFACGALTYLLIQRPLMMARFKQKFQARHQMLDLPLRMEISSDHLIYEVGGVTQLARWPAVDELFQSHDYWIFLAQAQSMFAPRRFFENAEEERMFVREALALMTPDARSRSTEAERFAVAA